MKSVENQMHIYQRIYRFSRRNIKPDKIAMTLDLPIKTVQKVLERFHRSQVHDEHQEEEIKREESFLDVYIVPKVRYLVADISGWLTAVHEKKLRLELDSLSKSQWKVIALQMRDVIALDDSVTELIVAFYNQLLDRGRFTAILDPSPAIESYIIQHNLEQQIPVFGTEKTFEEEAFSRRRIARQHAVRTG
jgi:anti-anti-sigma regulatory factor